MIESLRNELFSKRNMLLIVKRGMMNQLIQSTKNKVLNLRASLFIYPGECHQATEKETGSIFVIERQ